MVDSISNAKRLREIGANPSRNQAPAASPAGAPSGLTEDPRIAALEATMQQLLQKGLPRNSKLKIRRDDTTGAFVYTLVDVVSGEIIKEWPGEELLRLRDYLRDMEGILIDKDV
jgi:uncharacterized FlaG/YvyC family protein